MHVDEAVNGVRKPSGGTRRDVAITAHDRNLPACLFLFDAVRGKKTTEVM